MWGFLGGCRFLVRRVYRRKGGEGERKMVGVEGYWRFVEWLGDRDEKEGEMEGVGFSREGVLEEALEVFGKTREYEERLEEWRGERAELSRRQEDRRERKAKAVEEGEYADAWVGWLKGPAKQNNRRFGMK